MRHIITLSALLCASTAIAATASWDAVTKRTDGTPCDGCTYRVTDNGAPVGGTAGLTLTWPAAPGEHAFGVQSVDPAGISSVMTVAQLTIPEPAVEPPVTAPPAAPLNVKLVTGTNTITVSWQPVAGAVSYSVLLDGSVVGSVKGTSSMRTVAPGKCLTPYHKYTVVAVDAGKRRSAQSLPASLTKVLCVPAPCFAAI